MKIKVDNTNETRNAQSGMVYFKNMMNFRELRVSCCHVFFLSLSLFVVDNDDDDNDDDDNEVDDDGDDNDVDNDRNDDDADDDYGGGGGGGFGVYAHLNDDENCNTHSCTFVCFRYIHTEHKTNRTTYQTHPAYQASRTTYSSAYAWSFAAW